MWSRGTRLEVSLEGICQVAPETKGPCDGLAWQAGVCESRADTQPSHHTPTAMVITVIGTPALRYSRKPMRA